MILLLYCENCRTRHEQTLPNGVVTERSDRYPDYDRHKSVSVRGEKLRCVNCELTTLRCCERNQGPQKARGMENAGA